MATCSAKALTLAEKVFGAELAALLVGSLQKAGFSANRPVSGRRISRRCVFVGALRLQRQLLVGVGQPGIAALQSVGTQLDQRFQILHAAPGDSGHAPLLRQSARELQHFDIVERLLQDC